MRQIVFLIMVMLLVISGVLLKEEGLAAQVANVTIDNPAPHGGRWGTLGGGFAFQSRTRNNTSGFIPDANVGASLGMGDPRRVFGATFNFNIYGLSNEVGEDGNFGAGSMDVQVNRTINDYIHVGAGVRNLFQWKNPPFVPRANRSYYFTTNFIIPFSRNYYKPFSLFFLTVGAGNGVFRTTADFDPRNSGNFNFFGSAAIQIFRGGNIIAEWNGYAMNAGFSIYPFRKIPALGATFAFADWTGQNLRFIMSAGYSIKLVDKVPTP